MHKNTPGRASTTAAKAGNQQPQTEHVRIHITQVCHEGTIAKTTPEQRASQQAGTHSKQTTGAGCIKTLHPGSPLPRIAAPGSNHTQTKEHRKKTTGRTMTRTPNSNHTCSCKHGGNDGCR